MSSEIQGYFKRFEVNRNIINRVLAAGLEKGGDYCDLFFQSSVDNSIILEDGLVDKACTCRDCGVGIRVIKGVQTGYSYSEDIAPQPMIMAAKKAASIANEHKFLTPARLFSYSPPNYYSLKSPLEDIAIHKKISLLLEINKHIFSLDHRIIKTKIEFYDCSSYILIATSEGRMTYDYRPMIQVLVSCVAQQGNRRERGCFDLAGRYGIDFFTSEKIDFLAAETVRRTLFLLDAKKPVEGEMAVVLAAGSSGILLHEAIGHGMEADFVRKGISAFSQKIGENISSNFVTIVDDSTIPGLRGTFNIDDEGIDSRKTVLVENGIMKNYIHDRISSSFCGVNPTGNARRESFRYPTLPRMSNTYMLPGPYDDEEIIRSVNFGIYANSFTNGEVLIGAGDFSFFARSGYLIERGKLTMPLKDFNIIGNGAEVLKKIVMVGNTLKFAEGGWGCVKDDQVVPVSFGLPTIKISSLTVSGQQKNNCGK
ncbi:MAG: metallopeptidase TldD-related protein [Acidobacteria bacterium]|nr:metallopeptidase TldD-related protein [Acidobacteriota bacterium]